MQISACFAAVICVFRHSGFVAVDA